jgi:hypothetical protein
MAFADGYSPATLTRQVSPDDASEHSLEIRLTPIRSAGRLRVIAPDGSEAIGAQAWALDEAMEPLWSGESRDGVIEIPETIADGTLLLVRHSSFASTIRRWSSDAVEWRLDRPAPPLTLSVSRRGSPARAARIAMWLDGVRLYGVALALATWSTPTADMQGIWIARNLPPRPARLLALSLDGRTSVEERTNDALAATVAFPWPRPAKLDTAH